MNNREGESNMKQKIRIKVCVDPNIYSVLETKTVLVICHLRAASKYYYYFALMKTCKVIVQRESWYKWLPKMLHFISKHKNKTLIVHFIIKWLHSLGILIWFMESSVGKQWTLYILVTSMNSFLDCLLGTKSGNRLRMYAF